MKINFPLKSRGGCKGVLLYNFDNLDSAALFTIYIVQKLTSEEIIIIIIMFFFNWYPPKKLKYGKPRLGESMLT